MLSVLAAIVRCVFHELLYDPLPDRLPFEKPQWREGWFAVIIAAVTKPAEPISDEVYQQRVNAQKLIRTAYSEVLADQEASRYKPAEFERAWRERLARMFDQHAEARAGEPDTEFMWRLFDAMSKARRDMINRACTTTSKPIRMTSEAATRTFGFKIVAGSEELGVVRYGICELCQVGFLYKISFPPDWQYCGLGRRALSEMERRHPNVCWYTTGQFEWVQGFYRKYRADSKSPWTANKHPCAHY